MPFPNEHACRLKEPTEFQQGTFRRTPDGTWELKGAGLLKVPQTIDVISGQLKGDDDPDHRHAQALRFPTKDWTAEEAKRWLADNGVKYIAFVAAVKKKKKKSRR